MNKFSEADIKREYNEQIESEKMTVLIKNAETGAIENRTMETLHDAVVAHYTRIGLYDHATALKQKCYALGEMGETTDAVLKGDLEEIKDGIGDVLVCLINWADFSANGYFMRSYYAACRGGYEYSTLDLCVDLHRQISGICAGSLHLIHVIQLLDCLAHEYRLTLEDCLGHAYDIVSKRNIKFLNGVAVKEADWHKYPELAQK